MVWFQEYRFLTNLSLKTLFKTDWRFFSLDNDFIRIIIIFIILNTNSSDLVISGV
jgi:hypothetical protein